MRVLEDAVNKPAEFMPAIQRLLKDKSPDNIAYLYELVKSYRDWSSGTKYSWTSRFVYDVETAWMRQDEFIENI